jgi:hypothetical protein
MHSLGSGRSNLFSKAIFGLSIVGQVGNLRRIGNPPSGYDPIFGEAGCQPAAGYQPAPHKQLDFDGTGVQHVDVDFWFGAA